MADETKRPVRILMLEDSPLDAELATARLRKADLTPEITLARSRAEFEAAVERNCYDLVLADYALPDFDGIAALSLALEKCPGVPFIFISGRVGEEVAIDTLQRGATDYVLKHRLERLVPAVLRALRESEEHVIRVRAEANLRQSELRFEQVIEAVPEMIWIAAPDCTLLYSNQAWRALVADGLNQWCLPELFHPEDYPRVAAAWQTALQSHKPFTLEVRFLRRADNSYPWHLLRVMPIQAPEERRGGGEINWLGAAADTENQKRSEEALRTAEKLSVTGRMAASIAHEINNPLESLTNLLFLARLESEGNERALAYLDMSENELERIATITRQTLQFYRDPSVPISVDARELADEVFHLFASRLSSKHIHTTVQIAPGLTFEAIKGEIRQVLINLVNNAIDAVAQGGCIDIEANRVEGEGEPAVELMVHDNGTGITPEQATRLFTPFFSTKGAHGTGLGLWVSKGIMEKHGGTLQLQTHDGDGSKRTTARAVLPVKAAPELQPSPATAPARLPS